MPLRKVDYKLTAEEYLEGEQHSDIRHEYLAGVVYAMSGGTLNHNRITANIFSNLDNAIDGSACRTYVNDVKVRVQTLERDYFYYPDVVVTCSAEDNKDEDKKVFIEHPSVIVEVLSDSTSRVDHNEKFFSYRSLESLEEYVLVSQKTKQVTIARKSNQWRPEILEGNDFILALDSLKVDISSAKIYKNVRLKD